MAWTEKRGSMHVGYYRDAEGKKHRAGSDKLKTKAKALAQDEESKIRGGVWQDPRAGVRTLTDYFEQDWLPNKNVEVQTVVQYLAHWKYIKPALGSTPVNKITSAQVQRFVISLERHENELSPATIHAIFTTLKTCLGGLRGVSALRDGLIRESPCRFATLPAKDQKAVQVYEVEEVEALMAAMPNWWRPIPIFLAETGMRWGEMLGLQLSDFTDDYSSVTIQRTIIRVGGEAGALLGMETGYRIKHKPKNRKPRTIAMTEVASTLVARMVRERELFPMDRLFSAPDRRRKGLPKRTEEWPTGRPISNGSFRTQVWGPAHEKAKIPYRKIHALRASHITWLLDGGAPIGTVMRRVGHANLVTTQRYYGVLNNEDQQALDALAVTKRRAHGA